MQPPGEETLVEQARRGDSAAFEALVVAYQSLAQAAFDAHGVTRPTQKRPRRTRS
jgi:hypothetical protein